MGTEWALHLLWLLIGFETSAPAPSTTDTLVSHGIPWYAMVSHPFRQVWRSKDPVFTHDLVTCTGTAAASAQHLRSSVYLATEQSDAK